MCFVRILSRFLPHSHPQLHILLKIRLISGLLYPLALFFDLAFLVFFGPLTTMFSLLSLNNSFVVQSVRFVLEDTLEASLCDFLFLGVPFVFGFGVSFFIDPCGSLSPCLPRLVSSFPLWSSKNGIRRERRIQSGLLTKERDRDKIMASHGHVPGIQKRPSQSPITYSSRCAIHNRKLTRVYACSPVCRRSTPSRPYCKCNSFSFRSPLGPSTPSPRQVQTKLSQSRLFRVSVSFSVFYYF